ncbi:MAG: tetratricopeptide repeat protein [Alphaproteobacteria bacterium]|nr:MAG: tetratricopeptide repeat protein [Alphaproteobacteria bacterium]
MRGRIVFLGLIFVVGLLASGSRSHASDLEQCELTTADQQQRYGACDRVQRNSSSSPRDRARALFQLGRLMQMKPEGFYQAASAWDAAIAADPTYVAAGYDAIKLLQPALAANTGDTELLVMIGRAYASVGLPERALDSFNEALKVDPNHVRALFESGQVFEMAGDFSKAAEAYRRAGENYDPSFVSEGGIGIEHPYLAAARSYDHLGETGKALALITNVIDHFPSLSARPYVFEQRASYNETLGLIDEAIADLTSALRYALPELRMPLLFKRALLYQKGGKRQEAERDFSSALGNGDRRTILRMQVYLRNHGYNEVKINGLADPDLMKLISVCLATTECGAGLGRPI